MTQFQKIVKYLATAFAIFLSVCIIGGACTVFASIYMLFIQPEKPVIDATNHTFTTEITKLDIDVNAANLSITVGEDFSVKSNIENLDVKENNGKVKIYEPKRFLPNSNGVNLDITIPTFNSLEEVKIETKAGKVDIEQLYADKIDFIFGAGEVKIGDLVAYDKADIDGGAGAITIDDSELNSIEFDMGVGELNLTGKLTGRNKFNFGVGEANINLEGTKEDYSFKIDKGIGDARIEDVKLKDDSVYGAGNNYIDIDGGIGAINIKFK